MGCGILIHGMEWLHICTFLLLVLVWIISFWQCLTLFTLLNVLENLINLICFFSGLVKILLTARWGDKENLVVFQRDCVFLFCLLSNDYCQQENPA